MVSPVLDSIDNITETAENLLEQLGKEQSCDQSSDQSQDKAEIHSQLEVSYRIMFISSLNACTLYRSSFI